MATNEENLLTKIFNEYVEKSPDGQVKMSVFYDYVVNYTNKYFVKITDSGIKIDNRNIKSIYFDDSRWENFEFKILSFNELGIDIDEKHKASNFFVFNCENITLRFGLKSNKDGFIHQNNFFFEECKFKMIELVSLVNKYKFAFNYELNFLNCEINKMTRIENKKFNNNLTFDNTSFKEFINFDNKIFNAEARFKKCTFEKEAYFSNSTFKKIDFFIVNFKDNVYFNNSKFNGAFMLDGTQFDKIAHFFNVEIKNIFSFSSCLFKESNLINFTTLKIDMDVKMLEDNINKISKKEVEKNNQINIRERERFWAENLRNSFAVIKHNFMQRNNLIEANKHKVLEFYAEELRLKYECGIKNKCCLIAFFELICAIFIHPRQTINYLQLLFYRHTSNHHTDLLKSFNTMLLLIGLFGLFTSAIILSFNCCYLDTFATSIHSNIELYNTHIKHYIIAHESRLIFINFGITFGFLLIFFILCICFQNKIARFIVVSLSYICSILLLLFSPKSIISITNLFSGNQHILDPLSALSGIYTILFILLIYSLQKTSRRNSIM